VTVSSQIIQTLENRGWIDPVGHRETPGRPALYATTRKFLDELGMRSLEELPPLEEIARTLQLEPVPTAEAGVRPANSEHSTENSAESAAQDIAERGEEGASDATAELAQEPPAATGTEG
jgi:segregation and condensation protein B